MLIAFHIGLDTRVGGVANTITAPEPDLPTFRSTEQGTSRENRRKRAKNNRKQQYRENRTHKKTTSRGEVSCMDPIFSLCRTLYTYHIYKFRFWEK